MLDLPAAGGGTTSSRRQCTSSESSGPLGLVSKSHDVHVAVFMLRSNCLGPVRQCLAFDSRVAV
jgi:hypothetical protein